MLSQAWWARLQLLHEDCHLNSLRDQLDKAGTVILKGTLTLDSGGDHACFSPSSEEEDLLPSKMLQVH